MGPTFGLLKTFTVLVNAASLTSCLPSQEFYHEHLLLSLLLLMVSIAKLSHIAATEKMKSSGIRSTLTLIPQRKIVVPAADGL